MLSSDLPILHRSQVSNHDVFAKMKPPKSSNKKHIAYFGGIVYTTVKLYHICISYIYIIKNISYITHTYIYIVKIYH